MHSPVYIAICLASLGGMLVFGMPGMTSMVIVAAAAIALLGVPHGGLDHWTGRRLLQHRFADCWWMVFFPVYMLVGALFAWGWFTVPTPTVLLFFLVSAWHFGREDQLAARDAASDQPRRAAFVDHFTAAAIGGLAIWMPALFRPAELSAILALIVPTLEPAYEGSLGPASLIAEWTWILAAGFVPCAAVLVLVRLAQAPEDWERWVPLATMIVAIFAPILVSFVIYFCGWHSWRGLQRLRRQEALAAGQFLRYVAPLSIAAILGVSSIGWWFQTGALDMLAAGETSAPLRTVFIGLSAIAVPHLFLHEIDAWRGSFRFNQEVYA